MDKEGFYQLHDILTSCFQDSSVPIRHLAYNYVRYQFPLTGRFNLRIKTVDDAKTRVLTALHRYYFITPSMFLSLFKASYDALVLFRTGPNLQWLREMRYTNEEMDNLKDYQIMNEFLREFGEYFKDLKGCQSMEHLQTMITERPYNEAHSKYDPDLAAEFRRSESLSQLLRVLGGIAKHCHEATDEQGYRLKIPQSFPMSGYVDFRMTYYPPPDKYVEMSIADETTMPKDFVAVNIVTKTTRMNFRDMLFLSNYDPAAIQTFMNELDIVYKDRQKQLITVENMDIQLHSFLDKDKRTCPGEEGDFRRGLSRWKSESVNYMLAAPNMMCLYHENKKIFEESQPGYSPAYSSGFYGGSFYPHESQPVSQHVPQKRERRDSWAGSAVTNMRPEGIVNVKVSPVTSMWLVLSAGAVALLVYNS